MPRPSFATTRRGLLVGAGASIAVGVLPAIGAPLRRFAPKGKGGMDHAAFDAILAAHVKPDGRGYNRVDYRALKSAARPALAAYLAALQSAQPSTFSSAEAHAYWVNLYNAATVDVVVARYPVASIRKINLGGGFFGTGPWTKKILTVEGVQLSLDDIEHDIVRPLFNDPLSHYALNCASYSCPNLATRAYTGATIAGLMAAGARDYVNHPRGVTVERGRVTASKIYSWYADDFGGTAGLKRHWMKFAAADLASSIDAASIGGYVYDWSLNDV